MVMAAAACTTATVSQTTPSPAAQARADGGRPPYTAADVRFMAGMIGHHAQAVLMAGWAPSHGASPAVRVLCERIVVAQNDEIAFVRSEEHTSELQSRLHLVCRLLLEKKKNKIADRLQFS